MPSDPATLLVHVQRALGISQRELGALIGRTKRTIQRWQDKGTEMLDVDDARILADRLRTTHPDLADEVLALGARHGVSAGLTATPEALAAILEAVAREADVTPEAARPLVAAAFQKAAEEGVTVQAVLVALRNSG